MQTGVYAATDSPELEAARGPVVARTNFRRAASGWFQRVQWVKPSRQLTRNV